MGNNNTENKKIFERFFAGQKSIKIIQLINKLFIKLPHLPRKIASFFTKIVPWLVLLGGIISLIAAILSFLLYILSLIALDLNLILTIFGSFSLILLNALLLIKAFKPLRKYNTLGWIYLFWANVLGILNSIINIISGDISGLGQISLTVALTFLGFYVLFEMSSFYTWE